MKFYHTEVVSYVVSKSRNNLLSSPSRYLYQIIFQWVVGIGWAKNKMRRAKIYWAKVMYIEKQKLQVHLGYSSTHLKCTSDLGPYRHTVATLGV